MKQHPILFTGDMVRAILGGRKTQTRRVVDPRCPLAHSGIVKVEQSRGIPIRWVRTTERGNEYPVRCPFGVTGDRLWVRETWAISSGPIDGSVPNADNSSVVYRADCNEGPMEILKNASCWSPSIHMPRWASRITLEVTDVRVGQVQEISDADALSEGCERMGRMNFARLWNSVAKAPYKWSDNPWVWVVTFARMNATERP